MSTLSRALVSSNLFVNSLGAFLRPGNYREPASCSAENVWQETLGRELRAELKSIRPLLLVSWVPESLQETQDWHLDTLGANSITGCQKKHSLKPTYIKKEKSSRPSSSHPNCLRGKRGQNPGNCLPKLIGFLFVFFFFP